MIRRSTSVTVLLFALLSLLVWYMRQPENWVSKILAGAATPTSTPPTFLIGSEKGPISELTITKNTGQTVKLSLDNGTWMVETGYKDIADQGLAEAAITQAQALRIMAVLDTPPSPEAIGLNKPTYEMILKYSSGKSESFKIGKQTVTQSGYYVETESGKVVIIGSYSIDSLITMLETPPFKSTATPALSTGEPSLTPTATTELKATPTP